ncbi:binding-protein-dependent transport systems inner membrane component [Kribbella flavida DSM 17836]|uniref:Binding-protein-dependent transport systems inner membrane component n=1 Tax=Kribbella flavida (strain DSM 17836 / JCM 10339 / NBRC 14399) TaxID=479435 RepID=D2PU04_KRIFD|nr:ABC transporter permease [Kribbella flavida]ADB33287.1 binding-protein-dependent transport systems inner membrane component [Kribbella flavida DSM 17836]
MRLLTATVKTVRQSHRLAAGLVILTLMVLLAVLSPVLVDAIGKGTDPIELAAYEKWLVPSADHLLGTDQYGRDVLAMVISALSVSLQIGAIAGVISTVVGVVVAFVAGYKGGWVDGVLSTFTGILLVIPTFPLLIALSAYAKNVSLFQVGVMISIFSWPFAAKTIRSQVLSLRSRPYVDLARVSKARDLEIIATELLPNLLPFIGVGFASSALGAIFGLVGLEVIGLGPGGVIDLGQIIFNAINTGALTLGAWPMFVVPIVLLTLLFAALNMINIGLEEVYNPRLRGVAGE